MMTQEGNILLPTGYFPPVAWFKYISRSDNVFIEQMETFPKQTYRNRCEIMTAGGKLDLVVPVSRPNGNHTLTKDIIISERQPWRQHHWKSIRTAYRSSPYFNYYEDLIRPLFDLKEESLVRLNHRVITELLKILDLNIEIGYTEDFEKKPGGIYDLRSAISPKKDRPDLVFPEYPQVFSHVNGFISNLSILDLLFNLGPDSYQYLNDIRT